jgi:hypothetical protein
MGEPSPAAFYASSYPSHEHYVNASAGAAAELQKERLRPQAVSEPATHFGPALSRSAFVEGLMPARFHFREFLELFCPTFAQRDKEELHYPSRAE